MTQYRNPPADECRSQAIRMGGWDNWLNRGQLKQYSNGIGRYFMWNGRREYSCYNKSGNLGFGTALAMCCLLPLGLLL